MYLRPDLIHIFHKTCPIKTALQEKILYYVNTLRRFFLPTPDHLHRTFVKRSPLNVASKTDQAPF